MVKSTRHEISADDMNFLLERFPGLLSTLASQLETSPMEVRDRVEKGSLSKAHVLDALIALEAKQA